MTFTKRIRFPRFTAGVFALGFALLNPLRSHAQEIKSMVNWYTGAALSNGGSTQSLTPLFTSIWFSFSVPNQQKWSFEPHLGGLDPTNPFGPPVWRISSTVFSSSTPNHSLSKDLDIISHILPSWPMLPVVQADRLAVVGDGISSTGGNTPWKFQRWIQVRTLFNQGGGVIRYFMFQDAATGMCLADYGNPATGGAVVEASCDFSPRTLWAVFNYNTGRWE